MTRTLPLKSLKIQSSFFDGNSRKNLNEGKGEVVMNNQKIVNREEIEKKELYHQIVEYSFETTIIHSDHKVLYINDAGVQFMKAGKKEDLIGANVVDVFEEEYRDFIVERIREGEEKGIVGELVETIVYRADGAKVEVDLYCHPVDYGDSKAIQTIIRDITPRKNVERDLIKVMTPIVPIYDGIAVLPLVGNVDEERALQLLDSLPPKVQKQEMDYLIIDVSGIYNIDATVLDFLFKFNAMLRLLGVSPICTGVRPELALKLVHTYSDNDILSLHTMPNVKEALKYLMDR